MCFPPPSSPILPSNRPPRSEASVWNDELFAELLLAEAMKAYRTIPGCSPKPTPAPRLVGIETNPGPRRSGRKNKAAKQPVSKAKSPLPRQANVNKVAFGPMNTPIVRMPLAKKNTNPNITMLNAKTYVEALRDPFYAQVGKLGFGTFVPTAVHTGWRSATITTTTTAFGICMVPTASNTSLLYIYSPASGSATLGSGVNSSFPAANASFIQAQAQSGRVVCAGLRVIAKVAANVAQGRIGGVSIPDDSIANLEINTPDNLANLAQYRDFLPDVAGASGGQVCYRPLDSTSFEFTSNVIVGHTPGAFAPLQVVVGAGWPIGTILQVSAYFALETLGGFDTAGDDNYSPPTLNLDVISNAMGIMPPAVTPSITAVEMLDNALSNIRSSQVRTGFGSAPMRGLGVAEYTRRLDNLKQACLQTHFPEQYPTSDTTTTATSRSAIAVDQEDNEPEHGLSQSVYLPSSVLSGLGLRRA